MPANYIRVIAIAIIRRGDSILVFEGLDSTKGNRFYRPLGGGVEFGETSQQAVKREIKEEIDQDITDLRLLTTLESIFTLEGETGHEIVYVYEGRFADASAYNHESFTVHEETETLKATWRSLNFFNNHHRLVPEALVPLLKPKP